MRSISATLVICACGLVVQCVDSRTDAGGALKISWSKEGVKQYTPSTPLNVQLGQTIQFTCTDKNGTVVLLSDMALGIAERCQSSALVNETYCRPVLTDCYQNTPDVSIAYSEPSSSSSACSQSGVTNPDFSPNFEPGMIYHLANFPIYDSDRCLFAMSIRISTENSSGCECPSPLPSPSPLPPTPSDIVPSLSVTSDSSRMISVVISPSCSVDPETKCCSAYTLSRVHLMLVAVCVLITWSCVLT